MIVVKYGNSIVLYIKAAMNATYFKNIVLYILTYSIISGCADESGKNSGTESLVIVPTQCLEPQVESVKKLQANIADYSKELEEQLYLATDQNFLLEDKIYNFLSIYVEEGSKLSLAEIATNQDSIIELNSIGSCDFHGNIALPDYSGTLIISCYGQINLSGNIDLSKGSLVLRTPTTNIINPDTSTNLQDDLPNDNSITLGEAVTITTSPSTTLIIEPISYEPISLGPSECSTQ